MSFGFVPYVLFCGWRWLDSMWRGTYTPSLAPETVAEVLKGFGES